MRPGVSQRIVARRAPGRRAIGRRAARIPVALLAQPPAQLVDPLSRALAFRARGPRHLVEVDLGEPLDRPAHLVGQRPRDVLEAAAFRIRVTHGPMIAREPAPCCACRRAAHHGSPSRLNVHVRASSIRSRGAACRSRGPAGLHEGHVAIAADGGSRAPSRRHRLTSAGAAGDDRRLRPVDEHQVVRHVQRRPRTRRSRRRRRRRRASSRPRRAFRPRPRRGRRRSGSC